MKAWTIYFANKGPSSQSYDFCGSHVWMWELHHRESWVLKNWCFLTVVLEKALESPFVFKEIKPVNPTEYSLEKLMLKLKLQYFGHLMWRTDSLEKTLMLGRIDVETDTPILWSFDAKSWLIWKDPDAGKDWRQEDNGMINDEIVGWYHQLIGHEQALGVGDGQGSLACCSS